MNRHALFTAALTVATMMGCSSPSDTQTAQERTGATQSALGARCGGHGNHDDGNHDDDADTDNDFDDDGATSTTFTLTSLSGATLSGVSSSGQTFTASFTLTTAFRTANLSQFIPGDPVRPALVSYNTAVQNNRNVLGAVEKLVSSGAHAQIVVNNWTIQSFQPVP